MTKYDGAPPIAHPDWIDDAVATLQRSLSLDMKMRGGLPQRAFMLSTPAHRMLRALYGSHWAVAWWALKRAVAVAYDRTMPRWWHEWRHRRLYGSEEVDAIDAEIERQEAAERDFNVPPAPAASTEGGEP